MPAWYTGPSGASCSITSARPPKAPTRQPAADDLAERREVALDAVALGGPAEADAEAGDHLVEDQEGPHPIALGAQALEEPRGRRHQAHVGGDRLDDHGGEVAVPRGLGHHVVGHHDGVADRRLGDAGRPGEPERAPRRVPAVDEERVAVAVVVAGELQDRGRGR